MQKLLTLLAFLAVAATSPASWYWPFGSDDEEQKPVRRLSEVMEPVSLLIDEASDLAMDGKSQEAIEKYREALKGLDEIEAEEPERAATPEFATVRNKRAYVNAAIDSLLLAQVKSNASPVAVSDTTELEKKLAAEKVKKATPAKALTRRERIMKDIDDGKFDRAAERIEEMLAEKPNSAAALNLKAMMEMAQGKAKDAEKTLDQAIMSNPRSYFAYYNMAELLLQSSPNSKDAAKRFYETGRAVGGPKDEQLEEALR
jgi:tetratricopeptide (TPR) repeat protein